MDASCPLCSEKSIVFARPNFKRELAISCDTCGEFIVSLRAIERLQGSTDEARLTLKKQILPSDDPNILRITTPTVGSGEQGFITELAPRDTALR
jgi:hypothetical protein